jgi:hypothetical protein
LTFAGIELDTILFEARLPADKITKSKALLSKFLQRKKATLKEVQSLIGLLNFACSVVVPGRAFLRRLIDLTKDIRCASHFIRLSRSVKADVRIWKSFWDDFNGRSFFLGDFWSNSVNLNLYTDSAAIAWVLELYLVSFGVSVNGLSTTGSYNFQSIAVKFAAIIGPYLSTCMHGNFILSFPIP